MRITEVRLKNFRCYQDATIPLAPRTLVVGLLASGKSTLQDAILWALTGRCRGLDGGGRGVQKLIRTGAKEMAVAVAIDGFGTVIREVGAKDVSLRIEHVIRHGRKAAGAVTGPIEKVQRVISEKLASDWALTAALDREALLDASHGEVKAILLQLLDVQVPIAGEYWEDGEARTLTLAALADEEASAREARAVAKRALASLGAETPEPAAWDGPDLATLEAAVRTAEQAATAAATARGERLARQRADLADETRRRQALAGLDQRLAARSIEGYRRTRREEQAALEALLADEGEWDEDPATVATRLEVEIDAESRVLDRVQRLEVGGGCVLSRAIPCHTSASEFTAFVDATIQAIAEKREAFARAQAAIRQRRQIATRQEAIASLDEAIRTTEALIAERATTAEALAAVQARLEEARTTAEPDAETAVRTARARLAEAQAAARARQQWDARQTDRDLKSQEIARLERLCEVLGPKGARVEALAGALAAFEGDVNRLLGVWGYHFRISPDPWGLVVNDRPVTLLSRSERMRVGMALQYAVAWRAGLEIVIYDDLETLDEDRAAAAELTQFALRTLRGGQVILCATRRPDYQPPAVEGLQVIRVQRASLAQPSSVRVLEPAALAS